MKNEKQTAQNETIQMTYENLRTILLEKIIRPAAYGAWDEEKVATIVNRAQDILGSIFWDDDADEAPEVDAITARRVLYQVNGTYNDAVYTAQRRAGEILNGLRGL